MQQKSTLGITLDVQTEHYTGPQRCRLRQGPAPRMITCHKYTPVCELNPCCPGPPLIPALQDLNSRCTEAKM